MASTAPVQSNPAQTQNGNRSPHINGGQGDQQFKGNGRNPSHKKNWATRRDNKDGSSFNGNQDQRGERPRRHREDNEANGSPVGRNEEYRERRERKGRGNREASNANGNGNAPHTNGNHVKAEASSSHTEEPKGATKTPDHIDGQVEQVLVDELKEKYPQVPTEKIVKVIRKNGYDPEKSLHELETLQKQPSPWIEIVKGKKEPNKTPSTPAQQDNNGTQRDKRREKAHDQQQSPQHPHHQQQQAQQQTQQQTQQHAQQQPHQQAQQQAQQQPQHPNQRRQQHPQNYTQSQHLYQHPYQQYPPNYPQYHQHYQQVQPPQQEQTQEQQQQLAQQQLAQQQLTQQQHAQQLAQQQLVQQQQLTQQQLAQQHALQPYQQPYPQLEGEDILNGISKMIARELAEVQKKTEMLESLKGQLDLINNADKDHRSQLEEKRAQLEADHQAFTERLRLVENELATVKHLIQSAEDDKRRKVEDLYRNLQSNGVLAIANS